MIYARTYNANGSLFMGIKEFTNTKEMYEWEYTNKGNHTVAYYLSSN